jgi:aminomethyltransferase
MVEFGGWEMPVTYSSIIEEHHATRKSAGLFDISHMGRLRFDGPETALALDYLLTNRVDNLAVGQVRYSLVLNETAGVLDDVLVYRFDDLYMLVVNASNRLKMMNWISERLSRFAVRMEDLTAAWGMVACQGPKALEIAQRLFRAKLDEIRYYRVVACNWGSTPAIVSRTGYTGEDGIEIIVPAGRLAQLSSSLLEAGGSAIRPAGLGARDTLRLEAGMPLYGHELTEELDPIQAGLSWAVKTNDGDFVGKDALARRDPERPVRVGLRLYGRRIAREGFEVRHLEAEIGFITSGTYSPTLDASIAMAYVEPPFAKVGTRLTVIVRDQKVPATVARLPFYQRASR